MINFRSWLFWLKNITWSKKWFVLVILLKPIIDMFWDSKDSGFFSPPQLLGVIFPFIALISTLGERNRLESPPYLKILFVIIFTNDVITILLEPSLIMFGELIRHVTFIVIFYYMIYFLNSEKNFQMFLHTFLYSCVIPFSILFYEILVGPINPSQLTASRGGGMRYNGGYADIMTYAIYFLGSFVIINYYFLKRILEKRIFLKNKWYWTIFIISIIGLFFIKLTAAWSIFGAILLLLFLYQARKSKGLIYLAFLLIIGVAFAGDLMVAEINPLLNKEMNVIEGRAGYETSFNGRMSRWIRYFEIWEQMPSEVVFIGVAVSGFKEAPIMASGGMHNDFVRMLFHVGLIGLILYLLFFFHLTLNASRILPSDRFLLFSGIMVIMLFSISAVPTIYFTLQYLTMAIFVHSLKLGQNVGYKSPSNSR